MIDIGQQNAFVDNEFTLDTEGELVLVKMGCTNRPDILAANRDKKINHFQTIASKVAALAAKIDLNPQVEKNLQTIICNLKSRAMHHDLTVAIFDRLIITPITKIIADPQQECLPDACAPTAQAAPDSKTETPSPQRRNRSDGDCGLNLLAVAASIALGVVAIGYTMASQVDFAPVAEPLVFANTSSLFCPAPEPFLPMPVNGTLLEAPSPTIINEIPKTSSVSVADSNLRWLPIEEAENATVCSTNAAMPMEPAPAELMLSETSIAPLANASSFCPPEEVVASEEQPVGSSHLETVKGVAFGVAAVGAFVMKGIAAATTTALGSIFVAGTLME
ncbi:MAG: hypothetical protein P0S96_07005 [Simkaniaceae bacterium]|nr:hypothetical protein [Candidatus Sacchlamyda saccharinae]